MKETKVGQPLRGIILDPLFLLMVLTGILFLCGCASTQDGAGYYYDRGNTYFCQGQYDQAISDYNKAIELNPRDAGSYNGRGGAYYSKGEYEKAWEDVLKVQSLGFELQPGFLAALREASGREG